MNAINTMFGRTNEVGDIDVLMVADGAAVTRLPGLTTIYPRGSMCSADYEHPEGITLSPQDAAKIGLEIEG